MTLLGICTRNSPNFPPTDYVVIKEAKFELAKVMDETNPADVQNLINDGLKVIVRIRDTRIGGDRATGIGYHPPPALFVNYCRDIIINKFPMVKSFQLHNEPNHLHNYEGWGQEDFHAGNFNEWYCEVIDLLRPLIPPSTELIFPPLAIPHNDLSWLEICKEGIHKSDSLGIHAYWQNTYKQGSHVTSNHMTDFWGLRYRFYNDLFPNIDKWILEVGNSNGQSNDLDKPIDFNLYGQEFLQWYRTVVDDNYTKGVAYFILGSPSRSWCEQGFCWIKPSGEVMPMVKVMATR